MHIIVPVKQVPESEELRYDPTTRTLAREGVKSVLNTFDKRSLTEAIRLRGLHGGSITAITMGPPQARDVLVECLGRGVDRAIHLTDRAFAGADTLATARTLAAAVGRLSFDLLLLGKWATDAETGQVGPQLAELLDLPQVTGATEIELVGEGVLHVTRETDTGFERLECPLPALLTSAERLIKPTKTKPEVIAEGARRLLADPSLIETLSAADLGVEPREAGLSGSPTVVIELRPVEMDRERVVLSGDVVSGARTVLHDLERRGLGSGMSLKSRQMPALPDPGEQVDPNRKVWAVAEWTALNGGAPELRAVSLELAGEAARLAVEVGGVSEAVLIGSRVEPLCGDLVRHGAQGVLIADDPAIALYTVETYAWVLAEAIRRHRPWAVLLPATAFGRDCGSRVAARLGLGLTADCIGLELDRKGLLLGLKPAFGGQVVALIASSTLPQMVTVRPGMLPVYEAVENSGVVPVRLSTEGLPASRVRVLDVSTEGENGLALDDARLVVCVGTGIGGPDALTEVERFAARLGEWMGLAPGEIALGGTRKVVDDGWLPRHQQIGITGRSVAPDLYVGLGVLGNFNHTAGITRSRTILSVNTAPDAPVFLTSDLGVVADWQAFTQAIVALLDASEV